MAQKPYHFCVPKNVYIKILCILLKPFFYVYFTQIFCSHSFATLKHTYFWTYQIQMYNFLNFEATKPLSVVEIVHKNIWQPRQK